MHLLRLIFAKKRLAVLFLAAALGALFTFFASFNRDIFQDQSYSTEFLDRNNKPLRTFFSKDETYAERCSLSDISSHFLRAAVLIEDRKFYSHRGVVPSSLVRALIENIKAEDVVSGGSTITMQLSKLVYRHTKRNLFNKFSEIVTALKFELHLSKSEILEEYVNRLPFGNMVYGIKEASSFYFNKSPSQLSLNQAITLALIPKSPSLYNPKKHGDYLNKRRLWILKRFRKNRKISADEYLRATNEGVSFDMKNYPFAAPHFIDIVKNSYFPEGLPKKVVTTLDSGIQRDLESIVREHLVRLKRYNVGSAAAVIIDNRTHEIVGFLGSPDYFSHEISGYVNMAVSLRQPGSTLKPFVYGLALENGFTPASLLPDIRFPSKGGFFPENHDGKEHGPLRLRTALACSYNIPAFYMAIKMRPARVIEKLQTAGFSSIKSDPGFYGETIALGSGEVSLLDLVTAYSALADRGVIHFPSFIKNKPGRTRILFNEKTAFLLWDILADPSARFASFGYHSSMNLPFPLAVKTGTSKGFRDKWAIGVNSEYTIGIWLGNPSGENMFDLTRVGNATVILRDLFLDVQKDWTKGAVDVPAGLTTRSICPVSGELASSDCPDAVEEFFTTSNQPRRKCSFHFSKNGRSFVRYPEVYRSWARENIPESLLLLEEEQKKRISFPQNGDFFAISDAVSGETQQITFEVMGFQHGENVSFYLNGRLFQTAAYPSTILWPLQRGDHTLSIKANGELLDSVKFIVQ